MTTSLLSKWGQPVTITTVTSKKDRYGNTTKTESSVDVPLALYEPEQQTPRTDPRSPGVVTPAKFYFPPGVTITEDDTITDRTSRKWIVTSVEQWPKGVLAAVKRWGIS